MSVVAFAPHPDDAAIGCGGSLAKRAAAGQEVVVVYFTAGEQGSTDVPPEELASRRRDEAAAAADVLGVEEVLFLDQPDGGVRFGVDLLEAVITILREANPSVVYYPHENDGDRDHRVAAAVVQEALPKAYAPTFPNCGPVPDDPVELALGYEVWTPLQRPSHFTDVTEFVDQKRDAIAEHGSQVAGVDYGEGAIALNRYHAALRGSDGYVEAFDVTDYRPDGEF